MMNKMPALHFGSTRRITKDGIVKFLLVFTTLVLPSLLLVAGILFYYQTAVEEVVIEGGDVGWDQAFLTPSMVLEDKYRFRGQELVLRGKVAMAPAVCQRRECDQEDPCCGCQNERDLVISDIGSSLLSESSWVMRLIGPGGKSFCVRLPGSCDYQCPEWEIDGLYEVKGIFVAEPPPRGSAWGTFVDFYFLTEDQTLLGSHGLWERSLNLVKDLGEKLRKIGKTGSYVLQ